MENLTFKIQRCVYQKLVRNSDTRQKFRKHSFHLPWQNTHCGEYKDWD